MPHVKLRKVSVSVIFCLVSQIVLATVLCAGPSKFDCQAGPAASCEAVQERLSTLKESSAFQLKNRKIAAAILVLLERTQYQHLKIDTTFSRAIFSSYLNTLDTWKKYFLAGEVQQLSVHQPRVGHELRQRTLDLPKDVWIILQPRLREIQKFLEEELTDSSAILQSEQSEKEFKSTYPETKAELFRKWQIQLSRTVIREQLLSKTKTEEEIFQSARQRLIRELQFALQAGPQPVYDALYSATALEFDPHSNYFPPGEDEDFQRMISQAYDGIGVVIREEDAKILVDELVEDAPASRAEPALHVGDQLLTVTNFEADEKPKTVSVASATLEEANQVLAGPKETVVELTLRSAATNAVYTTRIRREHLAIQESKVSFKLLSAKNAGKIGYLKIPSFYADYATGQASPPKVASSTYLDAKAFLEQLEADSDVSGVIVDLRDNGGGLVAEVVKLASAFLPAGPILIFQEPGQPLKSLSDRSIKQLYTGPVVVLVNSSSASASEIFAAAIQDYQRGIVVGSARTFGKGTVQSMVQLDSEMSKSDMRFGSLKVTTQRFYRVNGYSTQTKGVIPDLVVATETSMTTEEDTKNPLPWNKVQSATYTVWKGPIIDVQKIRAAFPEEIVASSELQTARQLHRLKEAENQPISSKAFEQQLIERKKPTEKPVNLETVAEFFSKAYLTAASDDVADAGNSARSSVIPR